MLKNEKVQAIVVPKSGFGESSTFLIKEDMN